MIFTRKLIALSVGALALVSLAGFAGGGSGWCHKEKSPEQIQQLTTRFAERAFDDLEATPEQRKQLLSLKDALVTEGLSMRTEHKAAKDEALKLWESPKPDAQAVHAMVDERIERMRAFAHEAADKLIEAHQILTPEQRAQVAEKVREHHKN